MTRWLDHSQLDFNTLLLLERIQISWLPGWLPEAALGKALTAHPAVAWYLRHKCPPVAAWVDAVLAKAEPPAGPEDLRQAEMDVLASIDDLAVYVLDPSVYDAQPFLAWDDRELTGLLDFTGLLVLDIGSGTGRLAFTVAPLARAVFAVEPVANLRQYLREKARRLGFENVFPVDGLIEAIPFPPQFCDVVMGGHVFGEYIEQEIAELKRVTRPGGWIVLCPGNGDADNPAHQALLRHGFQWSRFEEPVDGFKRKYWLRLAGVG